MIMGGAFEVGMLTAVCGMKYRWREW